MSNVGFSTAFTTDRTPQEAFAAINDVRAWWTGDIEGSTDTLGGEFTYRHGDVHYSRQKITELIPGARIVWHILDAHLSFTADPGEWTDTEIVFTIAEQGTRTQVRFTHVGLIPEFECFESCSNAWGYYVNASLRDMLNAGKGRPAEAADLLKT